MNADANNTGKKELKNIFPDARINNELKKYKLHPAVRNKVDRANQLLSKVKFS